MRRLVLFDFDGTLADTLEAFSFLFGKACTQCGFPALADRESFLSLFDGNLFTQLEKSGIGRDDLAKIMGIFGKSFAQVIPTVEFFPGIVEMLARLAKLADIMVITSNLSQPVAEVLSLKGIGDIAKVWGCDVEQSKVAKIGRAKSEWGEGAVFYVGDTLGDIIEGRAAGAGTIAAAWGWHGSERLKIAQPDMIADVPEQIADFVFSIGNDDNG